PKSHRTAILDVELCVNCQSNFEAEVLPLVV
ncbi:MAG: hypothetical protein ACI9S6_002426, partial [Reinekea sp.]